MIRLAIIGAGGMANSHATMFQKMYERFAASLRTGKQGQTSFAGGAKIQACLECCMTSAKKGGVFLKISD